MIKIITREFPAYTGTEERRVYIYLPNEYTVKPDKRYPVLYMFDGHNVFYNKDATYGKSWGLGKYLRRNKVPLIVVAVECHHGRRGERILEYSPYDFYYENSEADEAEGIEEHETFCHGYGDDTLDWFVDTLKPEIDEKYRTIAGREGTFIMGSSMGGLMSLHALLHYNHIFSKACALSPALELWYDDVLEEIAACEDLSESELYMDYGMLEENFEDCVGVLSVVNEMLAERGMSVTFRTVPNGEHSEASWERQLPFAISTLMYRKAEK